MAKQKFWNGTAWEVVGSDAEKIAIKDTGNLFTATDVESALVEIENNRRTHLAESATVNVHGATSEANNNTIMSRNADGRAKVSLPNSINDILNVSDVVRGSYTTGQTEVSNITIIYDYTCLIIFQVSFSASVKHLGMYILTRELSTTEYILTPILPVDGIEISMGEDYKIYAKNISGSNCAIAFRIIGLGG